jgi:hypothetical protein
MAKEPAGAVMVKKKALAYGKFTLTLKRTGSSVWQSDGIDGDSRF